MRWLFGLALLLGALTPAHAEWTEASSDHFVIYADASEASIRRFSEELERYHAAMGRILRRPDEIPSPSNRLTVYVVGSESNVRVLFGQSNAGVAGFYIPRAGGSLAIVPRIRSASGELDFSQIVLLHEYAHHFLISGYVHAMPRWLSEGAAEFFAAARFRDDGGISLGRPANHRAAELHYAEDVSLPELLDHELYSKRRGRAFDAFYGRSWLLYHYLTFSEERKGQLDAYLRLVTSGTPSLAAGEQVFGDLRALDRELDRYQRQRRLTTFEVAALEPGPITISPLHAGEAEVMPLLIRSKRGVNDKQANEVQAAIRKIAGRHPGDAAVLAALAEAEYDAGEDDLAIAAADAALALDPRQVNAYVQKGYALFRKAGDTEDRDRAYAQAIAPFTALNALENDHPLPLVYFHRSFVERGAQPSDLAVEGLEWAAELAPFDADLRLKVALQQASSGRIALARQSLQPVAFDPHGGARAEGAGRLLEMLGPLEDGSVVAPDQLYGVFAEDATSATGG